jgi:hypothetical protein
MMKRRRRRLPCHEVCPARISQLQNREAAHAFTDPLGACGSVWSAPALIPSGMGGYRASDQVSMHASKTAGESSVSTALS